MSRSRRVVKRVLVFLAGATGAIIVLIAGVVAYAAFDREDAFAVANAEFVDVQYLSRLAEEGDVQSRRNEDFAVYAHRLKRGSGTVFGFRAYSPGKFGVIDDETYRKVTVWVAGAAPATSIELPVADDSRVRLLLTDGGSAWPRSACSHIGVGGTIRVQRINHRFGITIRAETAVAGVIPPGYRCEAESVNFTFQAKERSKILHHGWVWRAGIHMMRHIDPCGLTMRCSQPLAGVCQVLIRRSAPHPLGCRLCHGLIVRSIP